MRCFVPGEVGGAPRLVAPLHAAGVGAVGGYGVVVSKLHIKEEALIAPDDRSGEEGRPVHGLRIQGFEGPRILGFHYAI